MNREPKDAAKAKPSAEETLARIRAAQTNCAERILRGDGSAAVGFFYMHIRRIMEEHYRG